MAKGQFMGVLKPRKGWKRKPAIDWPLAQMQVGDWFQVSLVERTRAQVQQSVWQVSGKIGRGGAFRADKHDGTGYTTVRCIDIAAERIARVERERLRQAQWQAGTPEREARRAATMNINAHCRRINAEMQHKAAIAQLLD